ncbi:hypothetical protein CEXT_647761 [Caerostris extrusa]|uniref:Uncharacterized protein n=1 Tax=Caerostris extrusa TaxID=172846 RepID=A0AAV4UC94_CAEEX|nr:hypothetical protein CEXT_647761 [Caerostris extrusa]
MIRTIPSRYFSQNHFIANRPVNDNDTNLTNHNRPPRRLVKDCFPILSAGKSLDYSSIRRLQTEWHQKLLPTEMRKKRLMKGELANIADEWTSFTENHRDCPAEEEIRRARYRSL